MIKSISIRGYKSFHPTIPVVIPLEVSTSPPIFFYGLNGAGKSAIGEVIHGLSVKDQNFSQCSIALTDSGGPFRYAVYNEGFVSRVIGETMQGIFTIGEPDAAKEKQLAEAEALKTALEIDLAARLAARSEAEEAITRQQERGKADVWKAYTFTKTTTLLPLMEGLGKNAPGFFLELPKFAVADDAHVDTIPRLEERYADASGTEPNKSAPQIDVAGLVEVEGDAIWAEPIAVSGTSRLAPLIAKLKNGDWVDEGRAHIQGDQCPFCQEGLPADFQEELAKLLEGDRKLKLARISHLLSTYSLRLETLEAAMEGRAEDPFAEGTELKLAWTRLHAQMRANVALMRGKKEKPGEAVLVEVSDRESLLTAVAKVKAKVDDFNQRAMNREAEKGKIRTMLLQFLWRDRKEAYANHDAAMVPHVAKRDEAKAAAATLQVSIDANAALLAEISKQKSGVEASVIAINAALKGIGITEFWLNKKGPTGSLYCLGRPGDTDCSATTLSEGERTLISFLYFIEFIKGSDQEGSAVDVGKTIVVIDDPISSLSLNYIYDVASIIHHQLIKPREGIKKVRQVIVLTHSLFFFHELIRQMHAKIENVHKKCQMLRVEKNLHTSVSTLRPQEILNDYDALWHVLRAARDGGAPKQVVPNTMRCILEHFFSFTGRPEDFGDALAELGGADGSSKFAALQRYLDRGSHLDGINGPPLDWSQYNTAYFLAKMRAAMKAANHEDHYLRKMGEDAPVEAPVAA